MHCTQHEYSAHNILFSSLGAFECIDVDIFDGAYITVPFLISTIIACLPLGPRVSLINRTSTSPSYDDDTLARIGVRLVRADTLP